MPSEYSRAKIPNNLAAGVFFNSLKVNNQEPAGDPCSPSMLPSETLCSGSDDIEIPTGSAFAPSDILVYGVFLCDGIEIERTEGRKEEIHVRVAALIFFIYAWLNKIDINRVISILSYAGFDRDTEANYHSFVTWTLPDVDNRIINKQPPISRILGQLGALGEAREKAKV